MVNSSNLNAGHGFVVAAATALPKGIQFGPFEAPKVEEYNAKCPYRLKVS